MLVNEHLESIKNKIKNLSNQRDAISLEIDLLEEEINDILSSSNKSKSPNLVCRSGHTTGSTNHNYWQSADGETYRYVIVDRSCPQIKHITETSYGYDVEFMDGDGSDGLEGVEILLSHGETEKEAWADL